MMAGNIEEMLINLDSPEKNSSAVSHNHYLKNPLIPGPDLSCNELETNNPFDIVAQSAENWDPFELVLNQSLMDYGRNHSCIENNYKLVDSEFLLARDINCRLNRSNSVSNNIKFFPTFEKQCDSSDVDILNISSHSLDNSPSLSDKIKRVVKKRVSKCIERALNGSTSQVDADKHEVSSSKMCQYKISTTNNLGNRVPKLKKDELEEYGLSHFLDEAKQLSIIFHNMSVNEEAKISPVKEQKISGSRKSKTFISDPKALVPEEDIMSIQPPWDGVENDSSDSDDNSIGLPKVKLFYIKKKEKERKNELNQEKLAHYKKRIRASIDGNMSCEEDAAIEEMVSKSIQPHELKSDEEKIVEQQPDGQKLKTAFDKLKEKEPLDLLVTNKPIVPVMNDLRLKKVGNILRKGPLKAIVPLQKMTKSITEKMSPSKRTSPSNRTKGKNEDRTLFSTLIQPVATSTPNSKNSCADETNIGLPLGSKTRPRLSRKDNEKTVSTRRSVSLSTDARKSTLSKQPFSSISPNANQKYKRPRTAPTPNIRPKSSPQLKKNVLQKHANKLSTVDKENQIH